jgi:thiamine transporter ThiT
VGLFALKSASGEKKTLSNHGRFFVGLALYFTVRLSSHFLSGVLYWNEAYDFMGYNGVQTGFNAVAYSLIYNVAYLVPDTVIAMVAALFTLKSRAINRALNEFARKSYAYDSASVEINDTATPHEKNTENSEKNIK